MNYSVEWDGPGEDDRDYYEEAEDFEEECGLGPDGQCSMAGTEHCDWDCGKLNVQRIAAMKKDKLELE